MKRWKKTQTPLPEPRVLLGEACERSASATILPLDWPGEAMQGRFSHVIEERVELYLPSLDGRSPPPMLSTNCVCFAQESRAYAFVSQLLGYMAGTPLPRVALALPQMIARAERRVCFRVPVSADSGLVVNIATTDGRAWPAQVHDLGLLGTFLSFNVVGAPELSCGDLVSVQLSLGGNSAVLVGEVRRRTPSGYGLFFIEALREGSLKPPKDLQALVKTLERNWLASVSRIEDRWISQR